MLRKARVCGAAVTIPLAAEGVGTSLKRGCVVHTTENSVVLRDGENTLRVVDAQAFCAGSIVVRHVVELPANVTMSRANLDAKHAVAWDHDYKIDSGVSRAACVVNFETGEVTTEELPAWNEPNRNAFVDSNGKLMAVVRAGTGKLYGRSQWGPDEWKVVHDTELDARVVDVCSCGRFVSSALTGNCFMYLRAHLHSDGSIVIETWIFDLDTGWSTMRSSSRTLGTVATDTRPAEGIKLFVTDTWKFAILAVGNVVFQFQVDQSLQRNPVKRISMDHRILDCAWLEQNDTFAILLANAGQICIAHHGLNRFELLAIATSSTLSKRLSLSALLGKAVSAALQLVWINQEKQVAIDFGTACAVFNLEICNDNPPSISSADSNELVMLFSTGAFSRGKRRDMPSLGMEPPEQNVTKSPRPGDLVNIAQTILIRSHEMFEGSYFTLLCNIHKKLAADSASTGKSRDPIDCIGENLHLMEILLSFTLSMDPTILRQIALRLLSASPRYDRKLNYGKEIAQIMQQVTMSVRGVSELEDWWIESVEVSEFLRSYFAPIKLLQASIPSSCRDKGFVGVLKNIHSLCELVADQEIETIPETIFKADKGDSAPLDYLKRLLVSYTMVCRCLGVNCVLLDLEHIFAIGNRPLRKEAFCCFLKPGRCTLNASAPESCSVPSYIVLATVQYAAKADALNHILTFLLACTSPRVHSYLQDLCKATATIENDADGDCTLAANTLHWLICEKYISEATAIFRHLGARRQFRYSHREAEQDAGRLMIPYQFNQEFESFCQTLSTKMSTTAENCRSGTISLWKFAQLDKRLCERVIYLISRISWHLEAANYEISDLFKHSFAMEHFYPQLESLSSGNETLCHNIMKIRTAIFGCENELRLPKFRQSERTHEKLPFRTKKIVRSLMLVVWGLWIREKTAICTRGALLVNEEPGDDIHASESIGAQAAMCALHLQALRVLNGDNEELLSTQLSLLEEASTMNAHKTATVLAWGFQSHTIVTRHLKRYKSLRQIVRQVSTAGTLEECEQLYQQLQAHTRTGFLHSQGNYEEQIRNGNRNIQIDLLVVCCCDPEFLQVMSVLAKCSHDVVAEKAPASFVFSTSENIVHDEPEESKANDAPDLSLTEAGPVPTLRNEGRSESLISRDEVIALLQTQTRHLEDKIHAATNREETRARSTSNGEAQIENKVRKNIVETEKDATELADVQRKSRVYFQVQNLDQQRYSSGSSEAGTETIQPSKQFKRHDSVRNALKLFRLRQESGCHPRSGDQADLVTGSGVTYEDMNISTTAITPTRSDAQSSPTVSARRDKLRRDDVKLQPSRLQRNSQSKTSLIKEPVYPLRLEYGTASASLKLLGRSSQQRNPSVKRRQFVHQKSEQPQRSRPYQVKAKPTISAFEPADITIMKTTGAQTNDNTSSLVFPTTEMKEHSAQLNEIGPEKTSPVTQECVEVKSVAGFTHEDYSQKGVGIQCRLTEDNFVSNTRRKHGTTPLNIVDKYPIWVDLDKSSTGSGGERSRFKNRKAFLQVARFGGSGANNDTVEDEQFFTTPPCVSTILVTPIRKSEDGGDENQSDSQHSPSIGYAETFEDNAMEQVNDAITMKYRASYRQHFPVRERSSRMNDDRDGSSGINTLIDLRDNMQQMTQRLRALETCANSIDEQFKVSQKRLSRIGDRHPGGISSRTKVLNDIADVLESTEDAECQVNGRNSKTGLLSKKASKDLDVAKKLLETIEQLTISANDQ